MQQGRKTQSRPTTYRLTAKHLLAAAAGVEYRAGRGAYCPCCAAKLKAYNTQPWRDGLRIRYQRCTAPDCVLAQLGKSIKSVEEEQQ